FPAAVAIDTSGSLFIADTANNLIRKVSPDGTITTVAGGGAPPDGVGDGGPATGARLAFPNGAAVDGGGNSYVADTGHNRVRKVGAGTGTITRVAAIGSLVQEVLGLSLSAGEKRSLISKLDAAQDS